MSSLVLYWAVGLFVAAHFVVLAVLLTHATFVRRRERGPRRRTLQSQARSRHTIAV